MRNQERFQEATCGLSAWLFLRQCSFCCQGSYCYISVCDAKLGWNSNTPNRARSPCKVMPSLVSCLTWSDGTTSRRNKFLWWSGSIGNFSAMPTYEHLGVLICRCWEKVVVIFGDFAKIRGWHVWLDGFSIYFSQVTNRQQTALTFWTKSWDVTFRKINTHCKF